MKFGIRNKLLFYNFVLVFMAGVIVYYFAEREIKASLTTQIEKKLSNSTFYLMNLFENYVAERAEDLDKVLLDLEFNDHLPKECETKHFSGLVLLDINMNQTSLNSEVSLEHFSDIQSNVKQYFSYYSDFVICLSSDKKFVYYIFQRKNGKGFLVGLVPLEEIYNHIEHVCKNIDLTENLKMDIFDDYGHLLYSNFDKKAFDLSSSFYQKIVRKLYGPQFTFEEHFFIEEDRVYFVSSDIMQKHLSNTLFLSLSLPVKDVYYPVRILDENICIIFLIIIIPSILLSMLMSYFFINPLLKLKKLAAKFGEGDLEAKMNFNNKDEFYELSLVLKQMANQIQQKIEVQLELNGQLNFQLSLLKQQKDEILHKNSLIESSITYASLIQSSLLPNKKMNELDDIFIQTSYMPLQKVSGDFYFIEEIEKEGTIFQVIALIDCTGHGVPGAIMTVIAYNILSQIVTTEQNINPAEIITVLDEKVRKALKQDEDQVRVHDGMEIILCVINQKTEELIFSSSHLSLVHISGKGYDFYKGQKKGIGYKSFIKNEEDFYNQTIHLKSSDKIFLYTDGVVDQFGGGNNKKYSTKRLKDVIQNWNDKPDKDLYSTVQFSIDQWKNGYDQLDDMTYLVISYNKAKSRFEKKNLIAAYA